MLRNRGRSMLGEIPETDPRFLAAAGRPLGVRRDTGYGTRTRLLGNNPDMVTRLIYAENGEQRPWTVSVSSNLPQDAALASASALALAKGTFGNGGATASVEFDCTPDTVIGLPGPVVDLQVSWSPIAELRAANAFAFVPLGPSVRPDFLDITSVAALDQVPARGTATRSYPIDTTIGAGGPWRLPVPPFAENLHVYCSTDADYASITTLTFAAGAPIVQYTGAQLLALKNAGVGVPVPGNAVTANLILGAAINRLYYSFTLSL